MICYRYPNGGRGRKCLLWHRLREGVRFQSNYTGLTYKIRHHLTVKSKYVVNLITAASEVENQTT